MPGQRMWIEKFAERRRRYRILAVHVRTLRDQNSIIHDFASKEFSHALSTVEMSTAKSKYPSGLSHHHMVTLTLHLLYPYLNSIQHRGHRAELCCSSDPSVQANLPHLHMCCQSGHQPTTAAHPIAQQLPPQHLYPS